MSKPLVGLMGVVLLGFFSLEAGVRGCWGRHV